MIKSKESIFFLLFTLSLSNAAFNNSRSNLLSHYDLKVKNNEATCRLVNHPSLPESRRTLRGRGCMCDEDCVKYKDCCKDSTYYRPNEQSIPPSHQCSESTAVYIMAKCPLNWEDPEVRKYCDKSMQPLDDDDKSMVLPIANKKTRNVFGNRHCAACNNDMDTKNWIQFPMGVKCAEAPLGYLIQDPDLNPNPTTTTTTQYPYKYSEALKESSIQYPDSNSYPYAEGRFKDEEIERQNCNHSCQVKVINNIISHPPPGILLDIHLYVYNDSSINGLNTRWPVELKSIIPSDSDKFYNNLNIERRKRDSKYYTFDFTKYSSKAKEIGANARYSKKNKEFVSRYENKNFICRFEATLPQDANLYTRRCVPNLERKCPDGYENEAIQEECLIHTNIVFNKENRKPYRNKDCARCNGEAEDDVDGESQETRDGLTESTTGQGSGGLNGGMLKPNAPFKTPSSPPK